MIGTEGYNCITRDTVAQAWCDQDGACVRGDRAPGRDR